MEKYKSKHTGAEIDAGIDNANAAFEGLAGKLDADKLPEAVNAALAQAKASGEFDGKDGITPHVGNNGNWFIGDNDTGVKAEGRDGASVTIEKITESDKGGGDNVVTFSDSNTLKIKNGKDGKGAYQYAQEGGYSGTEEEFYAKLAEESGEFKEIDPTVPGWAKQPEKPKYTADEVGALPKDTKIPAKTTDIINDSGFITRTVGDLANYYLKSETLTTTEINALVSAIPKFAIQVVNSLPTTDISTTTVYLLKSGIESDLYTEYIYVNGNWEILGSQRVDLTGYATENWVNIQLSAYLKSNELASAINAALAQAKASGEFDGKDGVDGKTPVKGVDYYTEADKAEFSEYIASELAKRGQLAPEFANSVEECTDTSKMYVLPDGFIYAYLPSAGPTYTNLSETVNKNQRMGSGGTLSTLTGAVTTDFIPVKKGQTVRFKGFNPLVMPESKFPYICFYTGASESNKVSTCVWERLDWLNSVGGLVKNSNDVWSYTAFMLSPSSESNSTTGLAQHPLASSITHIRMCGTMNSGETVIVTVDEEITEGGSGGFAWQSTGHAFVPADYEAEINKKANKTDIPTELKNPHALTINGVEYDGSKKVEVNIESSGNILYGKKWVACGDSFTAGGYNASDGFADSVHIYQDGRFAGQEIVYPFIIGLRNDMNIVNLATGGQTMANSSNSFMTRYATIPADADYITIMLGINDRIQGIAVGTLEDSTNVTFCGAFNIAMEHILENHPFAHIGIMVSHGTNDEIMEATRGIAERWGVPYLDYGSPQVPLMNRHTGRNVCAKAQQIREKNFCVISDGVTPTNGHPNTAAHEYESTFIEAWLRTL